jgi:hypothetical protein
MSCVRYFGYDRIIAGLSTVALDRFAASVAVVRSSPSNTDVVYKHSYARAVASHTDANIIFHISASFIKTEVLYKASHSREPPLLLRSMCMGDVCS